MVKIGFISDLHTLQNAWHDNLTYGHWGYELEQKWNNLDLLIFAGDCTSRGSENDVDMFMNWFNMQPAKEKVMIAGNHDYFFDYGLKQKNIRTCNTNELKLKRQTENFSHLLKRSITYARLKI